MKKIAPGAIGLALLTLSAACAAPRQPMPPGHVMPPGETMPPGHVMPSGETMRSMPGMAMPGMGAMAMDPSLHVHMPYLSAEEVARRYRFRLQTEPARPVSGQETRVDVYILSASGNPVPTLQVHHERLAHFLIVSENLEEFHHLHPEDFGLLTEEARAQGRFSFRVTFGMGGRYLLAADVVDGMNGVHHDLELRVDGPPQGPTQWRLSRDRSVDGLHLRLVTNPWTLEAGASAVGVLQLSASGEPVTDLRPYLGALAHLAIFREGASASYHNHGGGPEFAPFQKAMAIPGYGGPKIYFEQRFDRSGRYRIFSQFQRGDRVYTVPFDVEVEPQRIGGP